MTKRRLTRSKIVERDRGFAVAGSFLGTGDRVENLRKFYAMTDEYDRTVGGDGLLPGAEGCEWCDGPGPLVYDHCHGCGRIRGLLCRRCNVQEGYGKTIPGWDSRCNGQYFYSSDWIGGRDVNLSPQWCGGTDEFATTLKDWWKSLYPELFDYRLGPVR